MSNHGSGARSSRFHWRAGDAGRALAGLLGATLGLQVASWLLPNFNLINWWVAILAALLIAASGAVLRPLMVMVATRLGWVGSILLAMFGQAIIVYLVIGGQSVDAGDVSFLTAFLISWIVAFISTGAVWVFTAGTDEAVTASLVRRARRRKGHTVPDPDVEGVVFIQADGVPYPVLELGVMSGTIPTLSRWVRSGSHRMVEWRPRLPATTPASQMGILHGTIEGIPAFRWVDRATGRIFVANRPADAVDIEAMHSDGHGLLADDGVSVSNLFTGDAPTAYVTMSAIRRTQESREARQTVSRFLGRPDGLARGVSRTLSEILRERFQASRAIRRGIEPRVHRGWGFAGERAALNGVLRDLNTSLVAESMLKGRRAIYVDYVDYDAVAHHAGIMRPESLDALAGVDAVLAQLEKVAEVSPRRYRFVVLSDHGQSQGAIFVDRYGEDLAALVGRLADVDVTAAVAADAEGAGRVRGLTAWASGTDAAFSGALARVSDRMDAKAHADVDRAAQTEREEYAEHAAAANVPSQRTAEDSGDRFIVFGSGNLGLVYVAGEHHRLTMEEISERFPALLPGLVIHPGISFAVVESAEHGPVAIGARGEHRLRDGVVVGEDPLIPFGPHAPAFVLRAASMPESPDILVNSLLDEMGEVAAFEGLVGCHGGLGGWQDRAMMVFPTDLPAPEGMIVGADAIHDQLVTWLEHLGHRRDLPPRRVRPYDEARLRRTGESAPSGPTSPAPNS